MNKSPQQIKDAYERRLKQASERQQKYIWRKRSSGYCATCAEKSSTYRCNACARKHADRMRAYWAKTHGKYVKPFNLNEEKRNGAN